MFATSSVSITGANAEFTNVTSSQVFRTRPTDTSNVPAFTWSNDENTGMYHAFDDVIGLSTAGVPRVLISTSNIGVHATNPASFLYVNGTTTILNPMPIQGLITHYSFEDTTRAVVGPNTYTLMGSPNGYVSGKVNIKAVSFTHTAGGTPTQMLTALNVDYNLPLSFSLWFQSPNALPAVGTTQVLMSLGLLTLQTDGPTLQLVLSSSPIVHTMPLQLGTWYHVIGTLDTSYNCTLYVNGVFVGMRQTATSTWRTITNITVGGAYMTNNTAFNGYVDDLRIYNRVLTQDEINLVYQDQVGGSNVSTDARLGVGVRNPQTALDVVGNAVFSGNVSCGNMGFFRNRIINGNMQVFQRSSNVPAAGTTAPYCIDMLRASVSISAGAGELLQSRETLTSSDAPYAQGHQYSLRVRATSACTTYSYISVCEQTLEGANVSDLGWGTAYGSPITVSFWVRTNAGNNTTIACAVRNAALNNSYVWEHTITASNTWQYVTHTIPAPPAGGTWNAIANTVGIYLNIGNTSTTNVPSTRTWYTNNNYFSTSTSTNLYATVNNFLEFTGLQLEKGTLATPFEVRPYTVELSMCQRYLVYRGGWYEPQGVVIGAVSASNTTLAYHPYFLPVEMRTTPGFSASATGWAMNGASATLTSSIRSPKVVQMIATTTGLTATKLYTLSNTTSNAWISMSAEFT